MLHFRDINNTENGSKTWGIVTKNDSCLYILHIQKPVWLHIWNMHVCQTKRSYHLTLFVSTKMCRCTVCCGRLDFTNDTYLLWHSGIHIFIVWIYKELSMLWWNRRVSSSLGLTLHILSHSLFLLPLINILFKQPADTPRCRYVHKSSRADPQQWLTFLAFKVPHITASPLHQRHSKF